MIASGKKLAKAVGIRFVKPKDTLAFQVAFDFEEDGRKERLYWTGYCSTGAAPQTIKTLNEVLEWNGDDEVENVPEGDAKYGHLKNQDCINRKKEVELDVQFETYEGKQYPRIKWVNNIGGGQFAGVSPEIVKNDLNASGFKALWLSARQGKPAPTQPAQPALGVDGKPMPF